MSTVMDGTLWELFEIDAKQVIDDNDDGIERAVSFRAWCEEGSMRGPFMDEIEMAGPPVAFEVPEANEIPVGDLATGTVIRYNARKVGIQLVATEEVIEDNREPDALKLARRNKAAVWRTIDIDCTNLMVHAEDTGVPWADGQPLASATHTLINGSTFRNLASVNYAPSPAAVAIYRAAMNKQVGHHGAIAPLKPRKVLFPVDQDEPWFQLTRADKSPELGNFARKNYTMSLNIDPVPLPHWINTTTEYCFLTDTPDQPRILWVRKPRSREWPEHGTEEFHQSLTCRYAIGFSDPRAFYFVSA